MDKAKALSMALHCADISHPAKDWSLHFRWTSSLLEEFFNQVRRSVAMRSCMMAPLPDVHITSVSFFMIFRNIDSMF